MTGRGQLSGRLALVTGGSRGIGREIVMALAQQGADIALNYNRREAEASNTLSEVQKYGVRCLKVRADVLKASEVEFMMDTIKKEIGSVEILVNNAGIARPQSLLEISEKDWDETIDINLKSAFLVSQAVVPEMRKKTWGRIINISSVAAQLGGVVGPHYAASKAGLIGLTHSYAILLAKEGITVNAIAPALIATEMVTQNRKARVDLIPVGRFGTTDEVADIVIMLIQNGYVTGQTINVNGGWYMS